MSNVTLKKIARAVLPQKLCFFLGERFYLLGQCVPDGWRRKFGALSEWCASVFVRRRFRARSYYPECSLKNPARIALEQLFLTWKWYGYHSRVTDMYFAFGLDRKGVSRRDYLFLTEGNRYVFTLNAYPYDQYPLLQNKMYAKAYLKSRGVRVPEEYGVVGRKDGRPVLMEAATEHDFKTWLFSDKRNLFLKLLDGECGNGAFALDVDPQADAPLLMNGRPTDWEELESRISGEFLVEERLEQHDELKALHPSSLNTLRIMTVMHHGEPVVIRRVLRIGAAGSSVDNWASGGIAVAVDSEGQLARYGFYKPQFKPDYTGRVEKHPDSQIVFQNYAVPFFHEAEQLALKAHRAFGKCASVGWDIAILKDGPVWIEGNADWDNEFAQVAGGGLRREFLKYLIPLYQDMKARRVHVLIRHWQAVR